MVNKTEEIKEWYKKSREEFEKITENLKDISDSDCEAIINAEADEDVIIADVCAGIIELLDEINLNLMSL